MMDSPLKTAADISLNRPNGTWVVRTSDAVIAESSNVVALSDGTTDPVIFFPQEDVAMAFLDKSGHAVEQDVFGTASYFSIVLSGGTLTNAAWTYEAPNEAGAALKGCLAFKSDDLAIELL